MINEHTSKLFCGLSVDSKRQSTYSHQRFSLCRAVRLDLIFFKSIRPSENDDFIQLSQNYELLF